MCTRFLWSSLGSPGTGHVLVGRSLDWLEPCETVLSVQPRGVTRQSAPGDPGDFEWTSKHGSIVALMYGHIAVDGMNEAGLQVSALYLTESDYGERDVSRPGLMLQHGVQYLLDEFTTVAEAVSWLEESNVQIIPIEVGGKPGTGHLALADAGADSAVVEFLEGGVTIHHGQAYTVMTNSPIYSEQLELQQQYAGLGGDQPLPGGTNSTDRFARASYYSARLPRTSSAREATAEVFSVIRNASAPFGTVDPQRPFVSTTLWRIVADLTNRRYFFESTSSPQVVWVEFSELLFEPGPALTLDPDARSVLTGNVTAEFAPAPATA